MTCAPVILAAADSGSSPQASPSEEGLRPRTSMPSRLIVGSAGSGSTETSPVSPSTPSTATVPPRRKLNYVAELRVTKAGISKLREVLVDRRGVDIKEFPKRPNGTFKLMKHAFFARLLEDRIELKGCPTPDVSAAQADLKFLSAEQLLVIREKTLDFQTQSKSHSAHTSFLGIMDQYLTEKLARSFLRDKGDMVLGNMAVDALRGLGMRIVLVCGAHEVLAGGWDSPSRAKQVDVETLPARWVFAVRPCDWNGCQAAMLHTEELWVDVLEGKVPDFTAAADGEKVAVVCAGKTTGFGDSDRLMNWEVAIVDPRTDDVWTEMNRVSNENRAKRAVVTELSAVLAKRGGIGLDMQDKPEPKKVVAPTRLVVPLRPLPAATPEAISNAVGGADAKAGGLAPSWEGVAPKRTISSKLSARLSIFERRPSDPGATSTDGGPPLQTSINRRRLSCDSLAMAVASVQQASPGDSHAPVVAAATMPVSARGPPVLEPAPGKLSPASGVEEASGPPNQPCNE